jgi:hypothetical protein
MLERLDHECKGGETCFDLRLLAELVGNREEVKNEAYHICLAHSWPNGSHHID